MKLLIISSEFPPGPGGIGTHAWQIGCQLSVLGWDVAVVTPQDYADEGEVVRFNALSPIRVVRLKHIPGPPIEAIYRYKRAARVIKDWHPDVMLASGDRSVWLASRLSHIRSTPWIAVGHGTEFGTRSRWERVLSRRALRRATAVVCVSEYTRSRMHAAGIRGRREQVIPNGADPSVFHPQSPSTERGAPGPAVITTVGNVTERKGQEVVIRALPSLPGVRYQMIGLPTRERELTALARELGVADRIEFVGRASQDEVVRRLNDCDLFVMTSRNTANGDFEGYGIAVVEAALCGKPAVVSSGSGLAEAIVAGETGLIAREGDPADTARLIGELLQDDRRRKRMGDAARARALSEQTWAQRAARYDCALRDAVRSAGRKIVVISDTPHYRRGGVIVGWGPTVRELDHLSVLFDELVHVAPVSEESAPATALPYASNRVRVRELRPSGGERIVDKIRVLGCVPGYLFAALAEMRGAEVVHLRCPATVSMLVALLLPILRRPAMRWIKYAGNWNPSLDEPWTYELQRRWLNRPWHRGVVTVNGNWPGAPKHVRSFLNPCLTEKELAEGKACAERPRFSYPVRLLFVGRLETAKGAFRLLKILARLKQMGLAVTMDVVGDGPERSAFEQTAQQMGVWSMLTVHGWLARTAIAPLYERAHLLLLPTTSSEGWPKVLSEGMAYGVVPIASRVSSIPEILLRFNVGTVAEPNDVDGFAREVAAYVHDPERWKRESARAAMAAAAFSYDVYVEQVRSLLQLDGVPVSKSA